MSQTLMNAGETEEQEETQDTEYEKQEKQEMEERTQLENKIQEVDQASMCHAREKQTKTRDE